MRKFLSLLAFLFIFSASAVDAQVQSPSEYLGYELGEHFTPHYKVLGYFKHVAEESEMVQLEPYGMTNERRELVIVKVSTADNLNRIDQIQSDNLKRVGFESGEPGNANIPIVWLSYNVHGNETSSSEAAIKTIWELVRPDNRETKQWLENVLVIMDPMVNPDGRDRYVNWYNTTVGEEFNAFADAREHHEPWPGGRVNHYYFDLNRDWAWQTQVESRQRIKVYQQWMPHVHVDFHEQGYNSPYYFAPAARPFHQAITGWQREFQTQIGLNHTKYFDEEGWLYFTRERFDLFYPSYGDTWPTFNGAIGMTYEQAGHSFAGLGIHKPEGDTLTLKDRLTHHAVTGLSTIEITAKNNTQVVEEFASYFEQAQSNPRSEYKSFVIKKDSNPDKVSALVEYLKAQKIEVGVAASDERAEGFSYQSGQNGRVNISEGDIVISAYQPQSNLVRVLFEPDPELVDSVTYDITAWELHYAFGVEGYALKDRIDQEPLGQLPATVQQPAAEEPYAYLAKWNSWHDLKFLAALLEQDIKVRYATQPFSMNGNSYDAGTLIITRHGNEPLGDEFDQLVKETAESHQRNIEAVQTGFVDSGQDFGSGGVRLIKAPRVALVSGEGTSPNMVGHIWHFFDKQIDYPLTMINKEDLGGISWHKYDVLIIPNGRYNDVFDNSGLDELKSWIRDGGRVIAVDRAAGFFAGKNGFSIERKTADENTKESDEEDKLQSYGGRERRSVTNLNAGSVFKIVLDNTHPLAFGYGDEYYSLKLGSSAYKYLDNGWNVGVAKEDAHRSGFVGYKAKESLKNSLTFGVQQLGSGDVIYMIDNPLYRAFWHNGKLLFGNAVFLVGN